MLREEIEFKRRRLEYRLAQSSRGGRRDGASGEAQPGEQGNGVGIVSRTWEWCRFEVQAEEIKRSCSVKDVSSQPVVVEDGVAGERDALPLQLLGKAKTAAAAIVEFDARGLAGRCQNHGSCLDGGGSVGEGRKSVRIREGREEDRATRECVAAGYAWFGAKATGSTVKGIRLRGLVDCGQTRLLDRRRCVQERIRQVGCLVGENKVYRPATEQSRPVVEPSRAELLEFPRKLVARY